MATWNDLAGYLRTNYRIVDDQQTMLKLLFDVGGGRSQIVFVTHSTMKASNGDWAAIESVVAQASSVDVSAVLKEASEYAVGGVVQYGDTLALRHTVPLATLDIDEFSEPFSLVMRAADADGVEVHRTGRLLGRPEDARMQRRGLSRDGERPDRGQLVSPGGTS